jgi:hypothetical protein
MTLGERLATGGVGSADVGKTPSLCDRAAAHAVESATVQSSEKTMREDVLLFLRRPFLSKGMNSPMDLVALAGGVRGPAL